MTHLTLKEAMAQIRQRFPEEPAILKLLQFLETSEEVSRLSMSEKIGLIAGKSNFPLIFAQSARKQGFEVIAAAHRGETDPGLEHLVSSLQWVSVGQLTKIINFFKKAGVTRAVMAGGITKGRLFTHLRPDLRALKLLSRMKHMGDDGIRAAWPLNWRAKALLLSPRRPTWPISWPRPVDRAAAGRLPKRCGTLTSAAK